MVDYRNVFVKFIPKEFDDQDLYNLFSPFGCIVSAKVMMDPSTHTSLGYGFVAFEKNEEAEIAIDKLNGHNVNSKVLMCRLANSFPPTCPSVNVYVKPLPVTITKEILTSMFGSFGKIQSCKIVKSSSKASDVVGLVKYEDLESAKNAVHADRTELIPEWPPLIVKYAKCPKPRKESSTKSQDQFTNSEITQFAKKEQTQISPMQNYAQNQQCTDSFCAGCNAGCGPQVICYAMVPYPRLVPFFPNNNQQILQNSLLPNMANYPMTIPNSQNPLFSQYLPFSQNSPFSLYPPISSNPLVSANTNPSRWYNSYN